MILIILLVAVLRLLRKLLGEEYINKISFIFLSKCFVFCLVSI